MRGFVWSALTAAQQAETTQQTERKPILAAACIGTIGSAARETTDAALRARLITAEAQVPPLMDRCAPAWTGMIDEDRTRLTTAVVDDGNPRDAYLLLHAIGPDGRMTAPPAQRDAPDAPAMQSYDWRTTALRLVDVG